MSDPIYLDYNATTPIHPDVIESMLPWLRDGFGNPSSTHVYGRRAHTAVERAREQIAALLGCEPDEIYFTSGGTEANNLAILGTAEAIKARRKSIVTTVVEHPATARPCDRLEERGWNVTRAPVDVDCRVGPEVVQSFVGTDTALVTVMLANNETGTLMPIRQLADIAHARGALMHTDAAQGVGKVPTRVSDLGVDLLSFAGHKLYAPKGVGALYVRRGTAIQPVLVGAGHERGLRPGTENVPYIVALGKACDIASRELEAEATRVRALRDRLWELLRAGIPDLRLNGHPVYRLPNTLNVSFPGVRGMAVLAGAPEVAASTGSACHEGRENPSAVLLSMGLETAIAWGAVRLSLGRWSTRVQVEAAGSILIRAWIKASAD
jgi:cysteine desulfurase